MGNELINLDKAITSKGEDFVTWYDEVIDNFEVERGSYIDKGACHFDIVLGWGGFTGGVVMSEDESGSGVVEGGFDDFSWVDEGVIDGTFAEADDAFAEEFVLGIEESDFEDFIFEWAKASHPEGFKFIWVIEEDCVLGLLKEVEASGFFDNF